MKNYRLIFVTVTVTLISPLLLWLRNNPLLHIQLFNNEQYNNVLNYQLATLILAGAMILLVALLTSGRALSYLNPSKLDGDITPEPWIGIKPKPGESWKGLGVNFTVIITLVTAVVIFFQVVNKGTLAVDFFPGLLLVILFALNNSFVEGVLYRFSFVAIGMDTGVNVLIIKGLAALLFGLVHYYGTPSGIPGVLMAGFIGWFLSKSMIETGGNFWAWFIHFLQDVVIMFALFMT